MHRRPVACPGPDGTCRGFTLVELLVVIAIIGVLVGLLLPAVQSARESARRAQCLNSERQLAQAVHNFSDANGRFPVCYGGFNFGGPNTRSRIASRREEETGVGWILEVLPQLEEQPLFDQFEQANVFEGFFGSTGGAGAGLKRMEARELMRVELSFLQCPSDASVLGLSDEQAQWDGRFGAPQAFVSRLSYKGNSGNPIYVSTNAGLDGPGVDLLPDFPHNTDYERFRGQSGAPCPGVFYYASYLSPTRFETITDGTSSTMMLGEDVAEFNNHSATFYGNTNYSSTGVPLNSFGARVGEPDFNFALASGFRSLHPGGANFAWCDGSVSFINESIDFEVYQALSTRDGEEVVDRP